MMSCARSGSTPGRVASSSCVAVLILTTSVPSPGSRDWKSSPASRASHIPSNATSDHQHRSRECLFPFDAPPPRSGRQFRKLRRTSCTTTAVHGLPFLKGHGNLQTCSIKPAGDRGRDQATPEALTCLPGYSMSSVALWLPKWTGHQLALPLSALPTLEPLRKGGQFHLPSDPLGQFPVVYCQPDAHTCTRNQAKLAGLIAEHPD